MDLSAVLVVFLTFPLIVTPNHGQETIKLALVQTWAEKLGVDLWHCGSYVTRRETMQLSFKDAEVKERSGAALMQDIARDIKNMTDLKISAVRRIMDAAENTAMSHQDDVVTEYDYYNVKRIRAPGEELGPDEREMLLTPNKHFYNIPVNTSYSAVHVPTNVFDKAPDILKAIKWSENLDTIFTNNYDADPSLSWQYFGSSSGFMRQYPALKWKNDSVDLYDCRTRSWFIEAATSPKDMVILVDNSGSMTGMRKEIARHVVNNILDTLGNNDFVNVFNFSEEIDEIVPCYRDLLVQANLANIRELKQGMRDLHTDKIANFSAVLVKAFELLQAYREERQGACCNQAIMLVTDGVPYNYKEIFEEFNWVNRPFMPVRVFTYLIGREVPDVREVKWMACANQGYYVHLSTLAEVREQVLQYVPVMSRPMVLWKNEHPTIWTPVYADITDPKMTDWLWEKKECLEQKELYLGYHAGKFKDMNSEEVEQYITRNVDDDESDVGKYQLMTSVSMPVFDRRENANITERILINEAIWVQKIRETRIAHLLGVAGTDVPIQDIQKLLMPHRLGVNGYAFIVTNNGFILIHPDLRPVFQGILKPSYNSVDLAEVELMDDDREVRDVNASFLDFRDAVINQSTGYKVLSVKYHYDRMRRVAVMRRHYHYCGIENTPFTLVVSLPEPYGLYRVQAHEEIHRSIVQDRVLVTSYFKGNNWKVHPDWSYCKYHYDTERQFSSPENEFFYFLERSQQPRWQWLFKRTVTPPEHASQSNASGGNEKFDKGSYFCDRDLFVSMVYDAKATEWFTTNISSSSKEDIGKEFKQRFGVTIAFVATRSGLTRWQDLPGMEENKREPHFSKLNNRAIDEIWYKRAVDQYFIDPQSFVYSVPFDAGQKNDSLVTASLAVCTKQKAPAAVVGFQFQHSALHALFKNITSSCHESFCTKTCSSEDIECYVLDNNGYIVVADELKDTGRFFGEVQGSIMEALVTDRIYKRIHMFDYQAVCFRGEPTKSDANLIFTPMGHLKWMIEWMIGHMLWMMAQANLHHIWFGEGAYASEEDQIIRDTYDMGPDPTSFDHVKPTDPPYEKMQINRTRPEPCDKEMDLYQLIKHSNKERTPYQIRPKNCVRPFAVQSIPYSNMVLVVVDMLCPLPRDQVLSVTPTEVWYNGTLSCHKVHYYNLRRVRPKSCINNHTKEIDIELCGRSCDTRVSLFLLLAGWIVLQLANKER